MCGVCCSYMRCDGNYTVSSMRNIDWSQVFVMINKYDEASVENFKKHQEIVQSAHNARNASNTSPSVELIMYVRNLEFDPNAKSLQIKIRKCEKLYVFCCSLLIDTLLKSFLSRDDFSLDRGISPVETRSSLSTWKFIVLRDDFSLDKVIGRVEMRNISILGNIYLQLTRAAFCSKTQILC